MDPMKPQDQTPNKEVVALEDIHLGKKDTVVTPKKKTLVQKIFGEYIYEDTKNWKRSMLNDYIKPGLKKLASDIMHSAVDTALGRPSSYKPGGHFDYRTTSEQGRREPAPRRRVNNPNDVWFESRREAERVFDLMVEALMDYNCVTVRAYYEEANFTGDWTDAERGWRDLSMFNRERDIYYEGGRWYLNLPRPENLRR